MEFPPVDTAPPGCENPKPTGWLVIGLGSWSQRAARVARLANVEVPPHPGRTMFYHRRIPPYLYNANNSGTKTEIARVDTAQRGVETPPHYLIADWLRLTEPARGDSCPSGLRRGPAAPG